MGEIPVWIEAWFYDTVPLRELPVVDDLEHPECMVGPRRARRAVRRRVRRDGAATCCWYHAGDWNQAVRTALRHINQALHSGLSGEDLEEHVRRSLDEQGVGGWLRQAVDSLVNTGEAIQVGDGQEMDDGRPWYINGRHRVTAMRDAGVRYTLTARLELLDPVTGAPITHAG